MTELYSFAGLVIITIGVTEVVKRALKIKENLVPLTALVIGFVLTIVGGLVNITSLTILTGLAVGLSACGLFDQKKLITK